MQTRIEQFEKQLTRYTSEERNKIMEALLWGEELHREQKRASGEPFYIHPMKVAEILIQLEMDYETIIAALLHDVLEDTEGTKKEMQRRFGKEVVGLVNGVTKISILRAKSKSVQGAETIRKMLFAMTKDIRVILIKLADKLHNMSTLEYLPDEKRKRIALTMRMNDAPGQAGGRQQASRDNRAKPVAGKPNRAPAPAQMGGAMAAALAKLKG